MASNREDSATLSAAYRAATSSSKALPPHDTETLRRFWREARNRPVDIRGNTILHFLAVYGNVAALGALIQESLVRIEELGIKNDDGDTPLHKAARFGQKEAANIILSADINLAWAANILGETPLYVSAAAGEGEVFSMLARYDTSQSTLKRNDGCTILHAAIMHERYDVAMKILSLFPQLARMPNGSGITALNVLATQQHSFRSASPFRFQDLGTMPLYFWQLFETTIYCCIPALFEVTKQHGSTVFTKRKRWPFINCILSVTSISLYSLLYKLPILVSEQLMLARRLIELDEWKYYHLRELQNPLLQATKHGITELVKEILQTHPEAAETWDENGSNIVHIAAVVKNRFLYDYLMNNVVNKDSMLSDIDLKGNTVMHYAAKRGGHKTFAHGPLKQMSWAVLWFKRVQHCTHPSLWNWKNSDGKTATEVFEEEHYTLQNDAESTIRDLANYGLVLAILLATIDFAAVFTVPGGFDPDNGVPIFFKTKNLQLWRLLFFLGAALFASVFNIAGLLAILNTKFDFNDFYIGLPLKYTLVLLAMFFAIVFTTLACCQAFFLEKIADDNGTWYVILVVTLVIVASFIAHVEVSGPFYSQGIYVLRYLFSYKSQFT
nr:protein ACCELERATED CELL DEATH 6-like [Ipomoea batatas]